MNSEMVTITIPKPDPIYTLRLHEQLKLFDPKSAYFRCTSVRRVPGGWVYWMQTTEQDSGCAVFVPYSNEFFSEARP